VGIWPPRPGPREAVSRQSSRDKPSKLSLGPISRGEGRAISLAIEDVAAPEHDEEAIPLVRPRVADPGALEARIAAIVEGGILTNGPTVRELEERAAAYLGVRHAVAVSSCTAGLMLVLRACDLSGDVVLPSFTFAATAHAVAWNGLRPVFADVDAETLTLSPEAVERALTVRTSAIVATHVYGNPCDVDSLDAIAREHGLRLFYDAAHAFGSSVSGRMVGGFGDAEVFSLSPTKVLFAAEGGIVATDDDELAGRCRIGRDYANPGDYDCRFVGLNARMSELHAAVALASLEDLDERIVERNVLAEAYRRRLGSVRGVSFPVVREGNRSTYKDLTILIDPHAADADADAVRAALAARGIESKRYYAPPVHEMQAYRGLASGGGSLVWTRRAAAQALTLPLWSGMGTGRVDRVADAVRRAVAGA
jgi:dTDP-4-amino-4,6-dideoxygalactose transaminase